MCLFNLNIGSEWVEFKYSENSRRWYLFWERSKDSVAEQLPEIKKANGFKSKPGSDLLTFLICFSRRLNQLSLQIICQIPPFLSIVIVLVRVPFISHLDKNNTTEWSCLLHSWPYSLFSGRKESNLWTYIPDRVTPWLKVFQGFPILKRQRQILFKHI